MSRPHSRNLSGPELASIRVPGETPVTAEWGKNQSPATALS